MQQVALTRGEFALVDDTDFDRVVSFSSGWYCDIPNGSGNKYAACNHLGSYVAMQDFIVGPHPAGVLVDHKNGDGLDNRRDNLRLATSSQNSANRGMRSDNVSGFKGVHFDKKYSKWRARVRVPLTKKQMSLGYFASPEDAARAYDNKAREFYGEFARTNF